MKRFILLPLEFAWESPQHGQHQCKLGNKVVGKVALNKPFGEDELFYYNSSIENGKFFASCGDVAESLDEAKANVEDRIIGLLVMLGGQYQEAEP